ncbi:hypothetical protein B0A50_01534 [Salinomyces thailandicus]|uniref:tRNA (adenine(58)-N(1))-methyltransferase catalytic subunit TRM61 n=1 Tax=Salinomyces thailandicus TaxID=706561 RepID=A0A4U0UAU3_9PEZI|nr:hypothetical protein B0A50_01534 [Salinomyces thailandica]
MQQLRRTTRLASTISTRTISARQARHIADARPFRETDIVLLRPTNSRSAPPLLTKPLRPSGRLDTHKGTIHHADILGKRPRDVIRTPPTKAGKPGAHFRLHTVRLDEYVRLTRRLVTPLYPQDAQLIVSLMDLHPEPPVWGQAKSTDPKLEILEAGTGHGALTLYLSRAIHAANPPFPRPVNPSDSGICAEHDDEEDAMIALTAWKATRRAVLHTVDVSSTYTAHAQSIVRGFRHALYAPNIDFHTANVTTWCQHAFESRGHTSFLSHAFLDLPGAEDHLEAVNKALRTDAMLMVFNPSLTQIMAAMTRARELGLPLELERVVELGVNGGTGGREWDVRAVKPRARQKAALAAVEDVSGDGERASDDFIAGNSENELPTPSDADSMSSFEPSAELADATELSKAKPTYPSSTSADDDWKMVCRPKVGDLVVGGGFLGIFRKLKITAS